MKEEGSFNEAVKGCDGVFHVAAPMEFSVAVEENIGNAYIWKPLITLCYAIQKGTIKFLFLWWKILIN